MNEIKDIHKCEQCGTEVSGEIDLCDYLLGMHEYTKEEKEVRFADGMGCNCCDSCRG